MKIQKYIIAFACSSLVAASLVALFSNKHSGSIESASFTAGKLGKLPLRDEGGMTPGNAFYVLDYTSGDSGAWYVGNGANVWAHFWNTSAPEKAMDVNLGNVTSFSMYYDYANRNVAEGIVPDYPDGVTSWNRVLLVRVDAAYDHIAWPKDDKDHAYNQTPDLTLVDSKTTNAVAVSNDGAGYDKYISAAGRIERWADVDGEWTKNLCVADGSTDPISLKASWDRTGSSYSRLASDVKAFFSNQEARKGGTISEDIAERYDELLVKYPSWSNFAER